MPSREVRVAIIGDPSSLQRALRTAETGVSTFGSRMQSVGSRLRTVGSSMTRNLTLPLVGFGILAARELSAGERALAQTEAVIESTGGAARKSVEDIVELSQSLSDLTSLDDEPIQEAANTLLTFRQIAGDTFDEATEATLDLSVAMDKDLRSSAVLVGKALNDPIRGLSALNRVGIQFTDDQREAIEAMVAFGDTAGAQQVILEELNAEFGGSAEALGGTVTGRLNRLKNNLEALGASILEDLLPVLEDFAGFLEGLADAYDDLTPTQKKFVAGLVGFALIAGPLSSTVGLLTQGLGLMAAALTKVGVALNLSTGWVGLLVLALIALGVAIFVLVQNWDKVASAFTSFLNLALSSIPGLRQAVLTIREVLMRVWDAANSVWNIFTTVAGMTFSGLLSAIGAIGDALGTVWDIAMGLIDTIGAIAGAIANLDIGGAVRSIPGVSRVVESSASLVPNRGRSRVGERAAMPSAREIAREIAAQPQQVIVLNPSGAF